MDDLQFVNAGRGCKGQCEYLDVMNMCAVCEFWV